MTKFPIKRFSGLIGLGFAICVLYWFFLACLGEMIIAHDAIEYELLGSHLFEKGWISFWSTGPHREPLYPFLISCSMALGKIFSVSYQTIQIYIQLFLLGLTQFLMVHLLQKLKIHTAIIAGTILYVGFSPTIVNSSLSLYSEIATYPIILGIVILMAKSWQMFQSLSNVSQRQIVGQVILLALLFSLITFTKAIFAIIVPLLLIPYFILAIRAMIKKNKNMFIPALTFVLISLGIFGGTVNLYKYANKKYNGSFRLTNSRTWALYGNTARRMKNLSFKEYLTAMTMVPGTQACYAFFKPQECLYWSYEESDTLGMNKLRELSAQADSPQKTDQTLIALSIQEAMKNPFQYFFLFALEGLKIFFWEFPAMQYFYYPDFILKIYRFEAFFKGLYFGMPFLTVTSFVWSLFLLRRKRRNLFNTKENESSLTLICVIGFIGIYTFLHSFFLIIPRYALPLVPLYLILIAFLLNSIFFRKKNPT